MAMSFKDYVALKTDIRSYSLFFINYLTLYLKIIFSVQNYRIWSMTTQTVFLNSKLLIVKQYL